LILRVISAIWAISAGESVWLRVKRQLANVLRLKATGFEFDGHEAVRASVEEQQISGKIAIPNLNRHLRSHVAEVTFVFP
jgi:hypothetical protein